MRGLRFRKSMPRIAFTKVAGTLAPSAFLGPLAPIGLDEIEEPALPRPDWVRIRTSMAGICGSDLKQVLLHGAWDNPMTALISFPHVLGHEAVGVVVEAGPAVRRVEVGQRVLLDPWLACRARGIDPPCHACQTGHHPHCRHFGDGCIPPGIHVGNTSGVPGAFSDRFVAHESQCFPIPDAITSDAAVLGDPFSVSLHSILRGPPEPDAPALVYGLGSLGLLCVAALRRLHPRTPVFAVGRVERQMELAKALGATEVLHGRPAEIIERVARLVGARILKPWNGLPWLLDGPSVVYDTVGSAATLETSIRLVRTRGTAVVLGVEPPKRFEWTPIYFKEVAVIGSNAFGIESLEGRRRHALDVFLELLADGLDPRPIITHRFPLDRWRDAFQTLIDRDETGAIKVLLEP